MSHTIPFRLVFPTHLVNVLDDAWLGEVLPDDGVRKRERGRGPGHTGTRVRIRSPALALSLPTTTEIPLPEGVAPPSEDPDDLPEGGATEPPPEPRWGELGLEDLQ